MLWFSSVTCRRSDSAPSLIELRDDFVAIPEDFTGVMLEIDKQRKQIQMMRQNAQQRALQTAREEEATSFDDNEVRVMELSYAVIWMRLALDWRQQWTVKANPSSFGIFSHTNNLFSTEVSEYCELSVLSQYLHWSCLLTQFTRLNSLRRK